uniref:Uncharacterized protein n=1 Tax=Noccaea caerulescens TaxID=107243 RepID=A0A1J3IUL7_NOCCA
MGGGSGLISGNDMERDSSSTSPDEEGDHRNLLDESDSQINRFRGSDETHLPSSDAAEQLPTFDVESLRSRLRRSFKLNITKRQCIVYHPPTCPRCRLLIYRFQQLLLFSVKVPDSVFRPNTWTSLLNLEPHFIESLYTRRREICSFSTDFTE